MAAKDIKIKGHYNKRYTKSKGVRDLVASSIILGSTRAKVVK
jgi:hypothetical protein